MPSKWCSFEGVGIVGGIFVVVCCPGSTVGLVTGDVRGVFVVGIVGLSVVVLGVVVVVVVFVVLVLVGCNKLYYIKNFVLYHLF